MKLITASPWYDLPLKGLSWQTCYSCHRLWTRQGIMESIVRALYRDLVARSGFDLIGALNDKDIIIVPVRRRLMVVPNPDLEPTWQLITAMVVTRYVLDKALRKFKTAL